MNDSKQQDKNRTLHELMETEFQQLVDIIEQKQILHEDIEFQKKSGADPITDSARQLHRRSRELGADTLAEFFSELENNARNGALSETGDLLENIHDEFEKVKDILTKD
jgi:hypothetical protein